MPDFALVALPGAYRSSVGALSDAFLLAADRIGRVFSADEPVRMETRLRVLSLDGGAVTMGDGRQLAIDGALDSTAAHAFVWLPAFRAGGIEAMQARLAQTAGLQAWLRQQAASGAIIGASGAAVALPIAAGLTPHMAVPVARALHPVIRALFPRQRIEERLSLVERDRLLLAGGLAGDFTLILRAMERLLSPDVARWLAAIIGRDEPDAAPVEADALVARAQLWLEQRFTGPVSMVELAAALSTSPATLNRRFRAALGRSPGNYVRQLRLDAAKRMLAKSDRSVDRVAQLVGYSDSRLFRAMFRQETGLTATAWRRQARDGSPA